MGEPNGPIGGRRALSYYLMHGINEFYLLLFHFIIFLTFVVKKDQPLPFSFCVHSRFFLWHFTSYHHDTWPSFFIHAFFALSGYFMKQKKTLLCMYAFSRLMSLWVVPYQGRKGRNLYYIFPARARACHGAPACACTHVCCVIWDILEIILF